jgi:hypothetical protein
VPSGDAAYPKSISRQRAVAEVDLARQNGYPMVVSRPARNGALSVLVSAGTLIAAASQTPPDTAAVLSRAGAYVERFIEEFSSVVAEERYRQELGPAGVVNLRRPQPRVRRELRSDFVILRVGPPVMWRPFRDVWEVDGKPVRDREERLTTLLTSASPSAYEQARSIAQEATRYNIGLQARTVNTPITALQFLETSHQPRVDFTQDSHARIRDQQVTVISYRERARPTIIRGILRRSGDPRRIEAQPWPDARAGHDGVRAGQPLRHRGAVNDGRATGVRPVSRGRARNVFKPAPVRRADVRNAGRSRRQVTRGRPTVRCWRTRNRLHGIRGPVRGCRRGLINGACS